MQPKDLANMLGISTEWLKTMKKQGLLCPEDFNPGNRSGYSEKGVEHAKKLTVLKKYGLSSAYIKKIEAGEISLSDALNQRQTDIENDLINNQRNLELVKELQSYNLEYDTLSADYYLSEIQRREQQGEEFMGFEDYDFRKELLRQDIKCPYCSVEQEVDLEDYLNEQISNENNGMGPDVVYYFDSCDYYDCCSCGQIIRIRGWIREYPFGAYDSDEILVEPYQEDEE